MKTKRNRSHKKLPPTNFAKAKTRRKPPIVETHKKATVAMCPFCATPHPLNANEVSACGTILEISAVQQTFSGKHMNCALCHKPGGTLVKVGDQYVHSHECTPGVHLHTVAPENSLTAAIFWRLPDFVLLWIAKKFKRTPQMLGPLAENGKITQIEGYAWQKVTVKQT